MLISGSSYCRSLLCCVSLLLPIISQAQVNRLQVVTELSPPEQIIVNGKVAGTATAKVQNILNKAELSATIEIYPWARAYKKAVTEANTLIYSMAKTEERESLFYWLTPVTEYKFGWVSLQQRSDIKINTAEDAKAYRTVVQRDDISHIWLLKQGFVEDQHFITCSDIGCSWFLLLNKKVDLIIESPDFIEGMLKQLNQPLDSARYISPIAQLEITAYLAANKNIDPLILKKLKLAIAAL
jgi:polar amino acid transport system substrate-binding protein